MRTYKEYYQFGLNEHLDWKSKQEEEWWRNKNEYDYLKTKGDYIETVNFLTIDEKNDASLFVNTTNVKNSEWDILFSMLGQVLVDWCVENVKCDDLWSFNFRIDRDVDENGQNLYDHSFFVKKSLPDKDWPKIEDVTDEDELKKFEGCGEFLCDIVARFIESHSTDIPNDWNHFSFGLDDLAASCKWGEWIPASDGYMNLGYYDEKTNYYEDFVECM